MEDATCGPYWGVRHACGNLIETLIVALEGLTMMAQHDVGTMLPAGRGNGFGMPEGRAFFEKAGCNGIH